MPEPRIWRHHTGEILLDRTRVMGVLNVTPDSFSDGGRYLQPDTAVERGVELVEQGAAILDIGGESTRPGSAPVPVEEEWKRLSGVIPALASKVDIPISVDTRRADIARRAIRAGASIVNDVTAMRDPEMARVVANCGAGVVLMHMHGEPATMQERPRYEDVVREVREFLDERVRAAIDAGVTREAIAVDPGIGFGKDLGHNLALLRHLDTLVPLGRPVVVGVSRKSFLKKLGAGDEASDRLAGSLAAAMLAIARGARVIRAHDVRETVRAARVADAILSGGESL